MSWQTDIEAWKAQHGAVRQPSRTSKFRGYADIPGTGPKGETCRSCEHYERIKMANVYRKCALMRAIRTGGPGTDIKAGSPSCSKWEKAKP